MNKLSKDLLYYLFQPEPILQFNFAYSFETIQYTLPGYSFTNSLKYTVNPTKIRKPGTNEIIVVTGDNPGDSITVTGLSRTNNGGMPIPIKVNVLPSYSYYTPSPYLKEANIVGWNGSAVSVDSFINYGECEFSIDPTSIGVIAGLTNTTYAEIDSGYNLIKYAVYGHLGTFDILVNNSFISIKRAFTLNDVFKIIIGVSGVKFLFNGIEFYSISCTPEISTYKLDSSLYVSKDTIVNASIKGISYVDINNSKLKKYIILDGIQYEIINDKIFYKGSYYSVITTGFVYIDGKIYLVQDGKIFINGIYVPVLNGTVTIDGIHGGSYTIDYSPIIIIEDKVYSIFTTKDNYWILGIGSNLTSKNYSYLQQNLYVESTLHPYYDITNKLKIGSSLMYSGGSYLSGNFIIENSISPKYGIFSELNIQSNLNYKGYSFISTLFELQSTLVAGGLSPSIPPTLFNGFELGSYMRNYYIQDPSLFIIT